jgi:hypothetical protein
LSCYSSGKSVDYLTPVWVRKLGETTAVDFFSGISATIQKGTEGVFTDASDEY